MAAVLPDPGTYDFVFDTPTHGKAGDFSFRFWVDDTMPPSILLLDPRVVVGRPIRFAVRDSGSGVDPQSLSVNIGGKTARFTYSRGVLWIRTKGRPPGKDRVTVTASDYQESKNMEDVGPVLPNTRVLHANVSLRR